MTVAKLDDVERRVLGHLPAWRSAADLKEAIRHETEGHNDDEIAALNASPMTAERAELHGLEDPDAREGTDEDPRVVQGAGHSVQSYTVSGLTDRLRADDYLSMYVAKRTFETGEAAMALNDAWTAAELAKLEGRGLATHQEDAWTMTKAGFLALTDNSELEAA